MSLRKVASVAARDFLSTVATKGFLVGLLVMPVMLAMVLLVLPHLISQRAPRVVGEVALVDPTGQVAPGVSAYLDADAIARRWSELGRSIADAAREAVPGSRPPPEVIDAALGEVPRLTVRVIPAEADLEQEKEALLPSDEEPGRLALAVVHPDAVEPRDGSRGFGSYDLYVREKLDDRLEREIRAALKDAIVTARIRSRDLDRELIETLTDVERPRAIAVTRRGEKESNRALNMLLPAGFMVLLLVSVLTGGQYLMTSTVEEKSSRVVEVLLSAVSPLELMAGKILGQMGVGLVLLALYAGLGIWALVSFALLGFVDLALLAYLLVFFVIAYVVVGSLMAAIGAAVNEMREAQTLLTPVMMLLMIPWILWLPITRAPGSAFAVTLSFIPPVNTFVTLLRMTSTAPPPLWQVWLSIAIGIGSAFATVWFAAKVFRIGLLMYGKPPDFRTLIRWARSA